MKKDEQFYNHESVLYSDKRYPEVAGNFIQFYFKSRLDIVLRKVEEIFSDDNSRTILEIGCADGIVISSLLQRFPLKISSAEGVDSSSGMIAVAQKKHMSLPIKFSVRNGLEISTGPLDIILEIGVINYLKIEDELPRVRNSLASDGVYICSISGQSSLLNLIRPYSDSFEHLYTYTHVEQLLAKWFSIQEKVPVGLFIPLLWKLPFARSIQEALEWMIRPIFPALFLEKVYILRPIK